ncbi:MAG: NAD-dependent epimerase/dehydratase family protein [Myxococcaceae bacterium]
MKAMVTGGGGFLGSNLVKALRARGDTVRVLARGDYPELRALGVETIRGDITDAAATAKACEGMDVVFHTAAKAGGWGDPKEYEAINVTGTDNVVAGCKAAKVPALVHTSSPSVVHSDHDIEGANESIPYATHFTAHYPRTKAISEQHALAASDTSLKVVALRPHFIWGPGDRHLLPRLIARAKTGRLKQIGSRDPKSDTIYIDNCVSAHLLAAQRLLDGAPISGKPYFVSDDAPIGVWTMANRMLACAGLGPVGRPIPAGLAYAVGAMMEGTFWLFGVEKEPLITRFAASELSHAQWFDISAAKRDLGYAATVSIDEGLTRLTASLTKS